jgi:hypothetical protein
MEGGRPLARKKRDQRKSRPAPRSSSQPTVLDRARDELFSAIRQCGVLAAEREDQLEWMEDTLGYMKERHPDLSTQELAQLREAGLRFCQPVIPHGREHTALAHEDANAA